MQGIKEQAFSGVKWNAVGRFSSQFISFFIGLILARMLLPSDYGVIGMLAIFFAIAQTFIDSGFGSALIRKKDCSDIDYSTAFYFNIVIGLASFIGLFLCAPYIATFFNTPILKDICRVLSINLLVNSLIVVPNSILTSDINFKSLAKINVACTLISGGLGISMAYIGYGVWSLVYQQLTSSFVRAIMIWLSSRWRPQLIFSKDSFKYLFGFGAKILLSNLLHTIYANLTTIIIGKYYTPKDLGYYSRGESLATFPSSNISAILQSVTYPILSKIQDDDKRLINAYRKCIQVASMVIFFGMFLLAALARPIIIVLLTEKWLESIIYLQIFCFAWMFDHLCQLNLNILYVKGRSDLILKLEVVKKIISISMIVASVPFGILLICLSRALYSQIAVVINTYYTGKLYGLGYLEQLRDFVKYFVYSIIAVIPAFLLSFTELYPVLVLILGFIISVFIYWLCIRRDSNYIELLKLLHF